MSNDKVSKKKKALAALKALSAEKKKKKAIVEDSEESDFADADYGDSDDDDDSDNEPGSGAVWHYWLDEAMDGKTVGWHLYDKKASNKLEGFLRAKGQQRNETRRNGDIRRFGLGSCG